MIKSQAPKLSGGKKDAPKRALKPLEDAAAAAQDCLGQRVRAPPLSLLTRSPRKLIGLLCCVQSSSAEVDATITATDIRITTQATDSRPAYQLHVVFPAPVDDERVQAKFNKKQHHITLAIPTLLQPTTAAAIDAPADDSLAWPAATTEVLAEQPLLVCEAATSQATDREKEEPAITHEADDCSANGCGAAVVADWASRLDLSNRLIDQSCLSYN